MVAGNATLDLDARACLASCSSKCQNTASRPAVWYLLHPQSGWLSVRPLSSCVWVGYLVQLGPPVISELNGIEEISRQWPHIEDRYVVVLFTPLQFLRHAVRRQCSWYLTSITGTIFQGGRRPILEGNQCSLSAYHAVKVSIQVATTGDRLNDVSQMTSWMISHFPPLEAAPSATLSCDTAAYIY